MSSPSNLIEYGGREIITVQEAVKRVGMSRRTVYNWIAQGKVELVRLPSGAPRIFADTLFKIHPKEESLFLKKGTY